MPAVRSRRPLALATVGALALALTIFGEPLTALAADPGEITGTVTVDGSPSATVQYAITVDDGTDPPQTTMSDLGSGDFSLSGLPDGDYDIFVDGGDFASDVTVSATLANSDPTTGALGSIDLQSGVKIRGTVLDSLTASAIPHAAVIAIDPDGDVGDAQTVKPDGTYALTVPAGSSYSVFAIDLDNDHAPQTWDHRDSPPCGCADDTQVSSSGPAVDGIDFDLRSYDQYLWFSILAEHGDPATSYPGVDVFLERETTPGAWQVEDHGVTDADGNVDLFSTTDGSYRLRFQVDSVDAAVTAAVDPPCGCGGPATPYALDDGGKKVLLGAQAKTSPGDGVFGGADVDLTFATPSSGGGTPIAPRPPRHSTAGSAAPVTVATPAPTPTPTPTASPSPSPSSSDVTSPSPQPTTPATTTTGLDLTWLWILIAVVLALIVACFVVVLLRGRRA